MRLQKPSKNAECGTFLPKLPKIVLAAGTLLFLSQSALGQSSEGYEPPLINDGKPHIEETTQKFQNFEVVRSVRDYRSVPILHGPWLDKEAKLIWRDSAEEAELTLLDNGNSITLSLAVNIPEKSTTCLISGGYIRPNPQPSTSGNWDSYKPYLAKLLTKCKTLNQVDMARILSDVVLSKVDYADAANFWKATSIELFGSSSRRCIKDKFDGYMSGGRPIIRCKKWSQ